ncbi:CoxG family protein [Blastococcus tunisiensis]|uniref:Carbon monoxide dehydrogenase subunit G n=1 Tax=Blastococcus tunisiensis TaxID=1798228 RepID=A0A1I2MR20_9ACTN|nr:SRPBCC domain-containing protein [Blastococcus sp. DSM 46838]SFF91927.1 Carbon monoxide dehydrogenase subunit G [Blastococcus sp. DSM 46838]
MKLREEFEVAEPVASVWTFFEQPEAVAQCVPGVEQLTVVTPDDIDVRLTQSVGPMTATFAATVKIVERVPEKLIAFTATGKSVRGAMGNVRATVNVQLEPVGERTVVLVEGDVALAGALGSVGQKVVAKQAGKVTAQFSRNLEAALGGGSPAAAAQPGTAERTATPRPALTSLPPVSAAPAAADPWAKVAAALSAVSVVLGIVALRRPRRRSRR